MKAEELRIGNWVEIDRGLSPDEFDSALTNGEFGHKAAQSKGRYSEADLRVAIEKAYKLCSKGWSPSENNVDEIIQSLNQPQ